MYEVVVWEIEVEVEVLVVVTDVVLTLYDVCVTEYVPEGVTNKRFSAKSPPVWPVTVIT